VQRSSARCPEKLSFKPHLQVKHKKDCDLLNDAAGHSIPGIFFKPDGKGKVVTQ
jgi:hypothetical protein